MATATSTAPTAPPLTPSRESHLTVLAVILIALFAMRELALALSATDLGFDEAQYWAWAQDLAFGYSTKPPLIAWLIAGTTSLCGDGMVCVRLPANLLHVVSAALLYIAGRRLYDWRVGFWSAVFYATMPATAVSSYLITTDVPLIVFWCIALIVFHAHAQSPRLATGLALGLALGIGLNAKYAMIFFIPSAALYILFTRRTWAAARAPSTWLALVIAAALIAPNVLWNLSNGFATLDHTVKDNMEWQGLVLHPKDMLEFIGTQFGMLGPVIFGAYLVILFTGRRTQKPEQDRFLLFMSLPVFLLITFQALMSQAEANWSATAFPAAVVLVAAHLAMPRHRTSFIWSVSVNGAIAAVILFGMMLMTPSIVPPRLLKPVHQLFGGEELRQGLIATLDSTDIEIVVVQGRKLTAEVIYALRGTRYDVRAYLKSETAPAHDFERIRPWTPDMPLPVAFVRSEASGAPDFLPGDKSLVGKVDSPSLRIRYGVLDVWKVDADGTAAAD